MTGINFVISVGRAALEGHFDLSLGRLHESQGSSSYLIGHIHIHIHSYTLYSIDPFWLMMPLDVQHVKVYKYART
jgi:hypothetical protein